MSIFDIIGRFFVIPYHAGTYQDIRYYGRHGRDEDVEESMRDKKIDLLRFIALSSLIMAHIDAPGWMVQLQNFNVPLIVMASAMALACGHKHDTYWSYVSKRIKRLVFPTWLFLAFYFTFLWATSLDSQHLTVRNIWNNFTFSNEGGFMWIIRVFILVALATPLIDRFNQKVRSNRLYLTLIFSAFAAYEWLLFFVAPMPNGAWKYFEVSYICYAIGYGLIFALGLRLNRLTSMQLGVVALVSLAVFLMLCGFHYVEEGRFVSTQNYKYPPSAYYFSYAIAASVVLWRLSEAVCGLLDRLIQLEKAVMFIAQNSLWIYFWHTLFLFVAYRFNDQSFIIQYLEVYVLSVAAVVIQNQIINRLILPYILSERARKEIKGLLTG